MYKFPALWCISQGKEHEVLPGPSGIDALEKFLETATAPPIGEFTRRNELKYMKASLVLLSSKPFQLIIQSQAGKSLVYYFALNPQDLDNYRAALKPLAKKFKEYLNFVTVDAVEYGHMLPALGLRDSGFPALAVFNPMYGQAFPYDQEKEITPEVVQSFVMDIVQGKVQPLGARGGGENTKHTEL
jgi:protein disulfide-isomerase A1